MTSFKQVYVPASNYCQLLNISLLFLPVIKCSIKIVSFWKKFDLDNVVFSIYFMKY